jgi:ubiquinone/menaquinone biosynthesis C-methylase UbiE
VAAPLLVVAHVILFGGFAALAMLVSSGRFGHSGRGVRAHGGNGMTLHQPRLYDWQVRAMTFGGDGRLRRWMLDLAGLKAGDKILDVGCGTGSLLLLAAERVGPSGALCGIEPSAEMAAHARRKADARDVRLEIVESSADNLPYPPESFDVVFCTLVLHHLPAPMREAAIRGMRRVLRPGGRVVLAELQRPRSWVGAFADSLALAAALHGLRPGAEPSRVLDIEPLMAELGFDAVGRRPFGSGSVEALVGRLDAGKRADDRAGDLSRADG